MQRVASSEIPQRNRIYHKANCIYAKRIKEENKMSLNERQARRINFCECSYCAGLKGDVRVLKNNIRKWEKSNDIKITYISDTDTLYISTEMGFWKIYMKKEDDKYLLFHRNVYTKGMDFFEAIKGSFHRQSDVKPKDSIGAIVEYIIAHDKAKTIIMDDYRNLPKQTKKQKKYYKNAKNRDRRNAVRRIDAIFKELESNNPDLKYAYLDAAYC